MLERVVRVPPPSAAEELERTAVRARKVESAVVWVGGAV
jgi:hypothetical protein